MPAGRPTVVDELVLAKLEEAFALGCTDAEACLMANISQSTLYKYQDANPDFLERKNELKESPVLMARKSVVDNLKRDPELALKYLERKKKNEFAPRSELTGPEGVPLGYMYSSDFKQLENKQDAIQISQTTEVPILPEAKISKEMGEEVRNENQTS